MTRSEGDDTDARNESGDRTEPAAPPTTAIEDVPRGVAEASCWPLIVAVGAAGLYATLAFLVLDLRQLAVVAGVGGILATVVGVAGWYWQGLRRGAAAERPVRTARALALLVIGVETATVGTLLGGYLYPLARSAESLHVPTPGLARAAVLTVLLVAGSITLWRARAVGGRDETTRQPDTTRRRVARNLRRTAALGALFLAGQAGEVYEVLRAGRVIADVPVASAYLGLTGLHWLHVLAGVVAVIVVRGRADEASDSVGKQAGLLAVSLYWHFVVAGWLFTLAAFAVGTVAFQG